MLMSHPEQGKGGEGGGISNSVRKTLRLKIAIPRQRNPYQAHGWETSSTVDQVAMHSNRLRYEVRRETKHQSKVGKDTSSYYRKRMLRRLRVEARGSQRAL
jgi:hypothetical protein